MTSSETALLLRLWDAFAAGGDETVLGCSPGTFDGVMPMIPVVRTAAGTASTRGFLKRFCADGQSATLIDVRDAGHRVVASVQTHAPPEWPQQTEPHGELVTVRDHSINEILVYPTVEEAFGAAGLDPDDAKR